MSTGMIATTGREYFGTVAVAMVTPFDSTGALDVGAGRRLAAHLADNGIDSLVLAGTTGEAPTTTLDEKMSLLRAVKEEVGERVTIIAGAGTNNTAATIEAAKASADAGADALLVVSPYYSKPSQDGLLAHFGAVAEATDLPICLYDIPGRCGVEIASDTIRQLATIDTIRGMKDAKGNLGASAPLIEETGLAWYSGDDPLNLAFLSIGATGFVSVVGHAAPRALRELYTSFEAGDLARAREINATVIAPLARAQARLGGCTMAKAALRLQGIDVGEPRLPVVGAHEGEIEELRNDLKLAGVL